MTNINVIKNKVIGYIGNIPIYLILSEFNPLLLNNSFRNNDLPFLERKYVSLGGDENYNALLINIESVILKSIVFYNEVVLKTQKKGKETLLNDFLKSNLNKEKFKKLTDWTIDKNNWTFQEFINFRVWFNQEMLSHQELTISFENFIELTVGMFLLSYISEFKNELDLEEDIKELLEKYMLTKKEIEDQGKHQLIDLFLMPFLVS